MLEQVLPNHPEAYLTFAELLAADERNSLLKVAALEYAKKSIDTVPLPAAQRDFQRGRWHAGLREWSAAVEAFRAAVKQDATSVRYRLALVSALEHKGEKAEALAEARRALEAQPADSDLKAVVARLEKPAPKMDAAPKQPPKK
jgi:hypothetical protein